MDAPEDQQPAGEPSVQPPEQPPVESVPPPEEHTVEAGLAAEQPLPEPIQVSVTFITFHVS